MMLKYGIVALKWFAYSYQVVIVMCEKAILFCRKIVSVWYHTLFSFLKYIVATSFQAEVQQEFYVFQKR